MFIWHLKKLNIKILHDPSRYSLDPSVQKTGKHVHIRWTRADSACVEGRRGGPLLSNFSTRKSVVPMTLEDSTLAKAARSKSPASPWFRTDETARILQICAQKVGQEFLTVERGMWVNWKWVWEILLD